MNPSAAIRTSLVLALHVPEGTLPLDAELGYDPMDPFAVRLAIGAGDDTVTWFFARDLLRDGTTAPAGDGDVRVTPVVGAHGREIAVDLSTPDGSAHFRTDLAQVVQFLTAAYSAVPTGSELDGHDLDTELTQLLG